MKKYILFIAVLLSAFTAQAQEQSKGYRGFADIGYSFGVGDFNFGRFSVETSHGYQINHFLFVGAGVGFQFSGEYETSGMTIPLDVRESKVDVPVFANARVNFLKKKVSPFVDLRGGTYVNNGGGLFLQLGAGLRIATNERQAVNIGIAYSEQELEFETFDRFVSPGHGLDYYRKPRKQSTEAISIKIGYEF